MLSVVIVAPTSTIAITPSRATLNESASSAKAFSIANASTSITRAVRPPSRAQMRGFRRFPSETRRAGPGPFPGCPASARDLEVEVHFLDRIGNVVDGFQLDLRLHVVLVEVGRHRDELGDNREPATAAAACLARLPDRDIARRMASPTASTSTMFFSTTALGGSGSTA
jgi:hypothetical protein